MHIAVAFIAYWLIGVLVMSWDWIRDNVDLTVAMLILICLITWPAWPCVLLYRAVEFADDDRVMGKVVISGKRRDR